MVTFYYTSNMDDYFEGNWHYPSTYFIQAEFATKEEAKEAANKINWPDLERDGVSLNINEVQKSDLKQVKALLEKAGYATEED